MYAPDSISGRRRDRPEPTPEMVYGPDRLPTSNPAQDANDMTRTK